MLQNNGMFNKWLSVPEELYYNISVQLIVKQCLAVKQDEILQEEPRFQPRASIWTSLLNILGYGAEKLERNNVKNSEQEILTATCETVLESSVQQDIQAVVLVNTLVIVILSLILGVLGICIFQCIYKKLSSRSPRAEKPVLNVTKEQTENYTVLENDQGRIDNDELKQQRPVRLMAFKPLAKNSDLVSKKSDTELFLHCTIDRFLVELDKCLGIGSNIAVRCQTNPSLIESNSSSSLQSPRLQRRSSWRRPKQATPSLPFGSFNFATDSAASSQATMAWHELELAHARHQWKLGALEDIDLTNIIDQNLKDILLFYQRNCPLKTEQWFAACLMVNYVLLLLEKELCHIQTQSPVNIIQLKGIGSMSKGLKIGKAGQFDCLMIVKVNGCQVQNVFHHSVSAEIPPGRVVLGIQEGSCEYNVRERRQLIKKVSLGEDNIICLLPNEVLAATHNLVEKALSNLGTKHKSIMDRLPFTIHKVQSGELLLSLDTRILHGLGLGLMQVGIRLVPAVPLLCQDWSLLPTVYAVPPWVIPDKTKTSTRKTRIFRDSISHLDSKCFWHLSCSDLETAYLNIMDERCEWSGIHSCHKICLQVLKALFSSSSKSSLLNRGEVKSFQLETVLFFLLLESDPHHWTVEKLPDRISDSIHFLQSALQSTWLPSFFIHNPHLEKQMPALKLLTILHGGRQENLLADMNTELVEKIINFFKDRLQETGLCSCVKDEFSTEMWEYEFFIFG